MSLAQFDRLDDDERGLWLASWQRKHETHDECGLPYAECGDPERLFYPVRFVCYASMEQAAARGRYDDLHAGKPFHDGTWRSWSEKRSASHPYRYDDGVHISVASSDLAPWDDFTTNRSASPVRPPEQSEVNGGDQA